MNIQIKFPKYDADGRTFVTWRPVEISLKVVDVQPGVTSIPVTLTSRTANQGGQLLFSRSLTHRGSDEISLNVRTGGTATKVWVGGKFPFASFSYGDVEIEARESISGELLGTHPLMVRVRKNANQLNNSERDRFLSALATLNGNGMGRFKNFRDMHVGGAPDIEAHGGFGFLPWHRIYLLDLERELQSIDSEVSLPYWRFDQAAPNLFKRDFIGVSVGGRVQFKHGHPLLNWVTDGVSGVLRGPGNGPNTVPSLRNENQTIALGGSSNPQFTSFAGMQGNPHGSAHMSNGTGWITRISTAPKDPLFFLLHCNVDRLWAKWQFVSNRHDPAAAGSYDQTGSGAPGNRPNDALWPWSGPKTPPRPTTAPGGTLAASPMTNAPGASPKIKDVVDYMGVVTHKNLMFAYDDVPFRN